MRLSKRERFLLAVLTLLLLWTGFYKFWDRAGNRSVVCQLTGDQQAGRTDQTGRSPRENRTWNRWQKNWNKPETDRSILQI